MPQLSAFDREADRQIKPLTEEEKKAKLAELREKLAAKRAAQGKEDEKAARANEAIRRKAGQDMGRVREDMAVKEAQRDAERKRQGELPPHNTWPGTGRVSCLVIDLPVKRSASSLPSRVF